MFSVLQVELSSPCGDKLQSRPHGVVQTHPWLSSPCGDKLQSVGLPNEIIEYMLSSPCGDKLQCVRCRSPLRINKLSSPCGDKLQCADPTARLAPPGYRPLAGISCNPRGRCGPPWYRSYRPLAGISCNAQILQHDWHLRVIVPLRG